MIYNEIIFIKQNPCYESLVTGVLFIMNNGF
uniref:Uncharacterized protein n=1 Tax=Podoviridae sp. ct8mF2 TaxID=2825224 RepID=A0A8S5PLF4_9CAUD|nr:MAG TPA: hypothetical protein [Podoviridae sp. ct8mF2]